MVYKAPGQQEVITLNVDEFEGLVQHGSLWVKIDGTDELRKATLLETTEITDTILDVPIERVHSPRKQPRIVEPDNDELAASINDTGQDKEIEVALIKFDNSNDINFAVLDGNRRLAAAKKLGKDTIPVEVKACRTESELFQRALKTFAAREGISPMEVALAINELINGNLGSNDPPISLNDVANHMGYTIETVRKRLKLTKLDQYFQSLLLEKRIPLEFAEHLASEELTGSQIKILKKKIEKSLKQNSKLTAKQCHKLLANTKLTGGQRSIGRGHNEAKAREVRRMMAALRKASKAIGGIDLSPEAIRNLLDPDQRRVLDLCRQIQMAASESLPPMLIRSAQEVVKNHNFSDPYDRLICAAIAFYSDMGEPATTEDIEQYMIANNDRGESQIFNFDDKLRKGIQAAKQLFNSEGYQVVCIDSGYILIKNN